MTVIHDHYTPPIGTTTEGTIHFRSPHNRDTNGKTLTTEQSERALVDSAFSVDLPPGQLQAKLDITGTNSRNKWWDIEVPEAGPARLLDLIAIGVNIPPQTTIEKFDEAVARLVESGSTAILTQTEADTTYAAIDDPRFDEIGGASDADVAAIVTDPTSQTKTSLDATYAAKDALNEKASRRTDLYDDTASRANGTPTTFASGQPLTLFGNAHLTIQGGAWTHTPAAVVNSAGYVQADLGADAGGIYKIGADVAWPTSDVAAVALVLTDGAWTDTPVAVRSVAKVHAVVYGNVMHVSTFNAPGETKYMDTSAAVSNAAWIPRTKDLRNDATFRPFDIEFDPSTGIIVVVRSDGSTVSKTVPALVGFKPRYAVWELYEPNSSTAASAQFKNPRASTGSRVGERATTVGDVGRIVSQAPLQTSLLPSRRFYRPATTEQLMAPITTAAEVLGTGAVQITRVSVTSPPSGKVVIRVRGHLTNPTARSVFWSIVDTDTGATIDSHRVIETTADAAGARWIEEAFDLSGIPLGAIKNYALFQVSGGTAAADAYITVGQTPSKAFEIEAYPVI